MSMYNKESKLCYKGIKGKGLSNLLNLYSIFYIITINAIK